MLRPIVGFAAAAALLLPLQGGETKLDSTGLKGVIESLGYTTKVLSDSSGKFEFTVSRGGFDIPVAAEISGSTNYVWLTVLLGDPPKDAPKLQALLNWNFKVQPSHFYITDSTKLMVAIPVENRNLQNPWMRKAVDKIVDDVVKTAEAWQIDGELVSQR